MANEDIQNLLKAGISAAKAGNKLAARKLLEKVLEQDDGNETAWMWFATVVETPREKRICLENVLEINPNNQRAKDALAKLGPVEAPAPQAADSSQQNAFAAPPPMPRQEASSAPASRPPAPSPSGARPAARPAERVAPIRRRRLFSPMFIAGGVFAVVLIFIGVYLLLNTATVPPATPTPAPAVIDRSPGAPVAAGPTVAPAGTVVTTVPITPTPLPSITPITLIYARHGNSTDGDTARADNLHALFCW